MKGIKPYGIGLFALIFMSIIATGQNDLIISEFMAINSSTHQDEDGDFPDWIEIYNPGPDAATLNGWYLTDDDDDFTKWAFPDVTIDSNEYLMVFASGKDRKLEKDKLHTNFKLSSSGEFLALIKPGGIQYTTVFVPAYPQQFADISYGKYGGYYIYLSNPTPGVENVSSTYISKPVFSVKHGYYYSPFNLELSSGLDSADIYYTTDASTPGKANSIKYTDPINVTTTTVIRAIAIKEGVDSSETITQSYIFPEDVIHQSNDQSGYPETWIDPRREIEIPGNYNMKSEFVNRPDVLPVIIKSLESLPVISIVSDIDNFFSRSTNPDSGGIYMYNGEPDGPTRDMKYHLGRGWIRPGSVEYFNSDIKDGLLDFQANCGLKIHGGATRTRMKTEKHSFKIGFKSEYGSSKLKQQLFGLFSPDQYDWFILRGGFDRRLGQQIFDPWAKSTMRDMGQYAARSKFVHVYLNGLYWGMYNMCEQMDENCMRDNLGGNDDDYDILKDYYEVEAGDTVAWDKLVTMAGDNIEDPENYQKLLGNNANGTPNPDYENMLNEKNLIDYIMMNMYAGTADWDYHNWVAARRRTESEGFHFLVWDAEGVYRNYNNVSWIINAGEENRPTGVFHDLIENDQFKNLFINHVNKHFFEGGALTPDPRLKTYEKWLDEIDTALIADQARWVWDPDDIWNTSYHTFIYDYFPPRTELVFTQFILTGLYPVIDPPEFNTENNTIRDDFELYLTSPSGGEIRYTLDGTDPGHFKLAEKSSILIYDDKPVPLPPPGEILNISARVKKDGLWSKLVTKQFIISNVVPIFSNKASQHSDNLYNYPNPMKDYTNIMFSLSKSSYISLKIYNSMGEQITVLENGIKNAGEHMATWNSGNIPSGVYICVLENNSDLKRNRITIIKE